MSAFSPAAPDFVSFLALAKDASSLNPHGAGNPRNLRFIPRNFLIDERLDPARIAQYASVFPAGEPASFEAWNNAHNVYLGQHVFKKPPPGHNVRVVATSDESACPNTFRCALSARAYEGTDLDTHFVRMIPVNDLAWLSGDNEDAIFRLGQQCLRDRGDTRAAEALDLVLDEAFTGGGKCDHRPVFAAFYEDFIDELSDPDDTTWPNRLRDRLGLYHLNQWSRPFPRRVFLFRYSVRELPARQGEPERRPIALPTVLDHRLAEAFCPAPRELGLGQVVNLVENANTEPAREVLHLFMPLESKHLFRVGLVTAAVPDDLGPARRDHLFWLRMLSNRDDYASTTDADLFAP